MLQHDLNFRPFFMHIQSTFIASHITTEECLNEKTDITNLNKYYCCP